MVVGPGPNGDFELLNTVWNSLVSKISGRCEWLKWRL